MSRRYLTTSPAAASAPVTLAYTTRWETDFADATAYPSNTVYGADGTYAITPSATGSAANFTVANYSKSSKFQITSGTGLEITNNSTSSQYTASKTAPVLRSLLTELYPSGSFAQKFRIWVRLTGTFVRASDACRVGIESATDPTKQFYNFGIIWYSGAYVYTNLTLQENAGTVTYGNAGTGLTYNFDVLMIEWEPGGPLKTYYGSWSSGWPALSAMTMVATIATGYGAAGSNSRIKSISDVQFCISTESVNATGGNAMTIKNLRLQSFGDP